MPGPGRPGAITNEQECAETPLAPSQFKSKLGANFRLYKVKGPLEMSRYTRVHSLVHFQYSTEK